MNNEITFREAASSKSYQFHTGPPVSIDKKQTGIQHPHDVQSVCHP